MKASVQLLATLAAVAVLAGSCAGRTSATPEQAKAMAFRAAHFLTTEGPEAAFPVFDDEGDDRFHDRDLYVFVIDGSGVAVAHGFNSELIGENVADLKDADGKPFVREILAVAKQGWVNYRWESPSTGRIQRKGSYIVHVGDYFVGVGAYK